MTHTQRSAYPRKNLRPRPTPIPPILCVTLDFIAPQRNHANVLLHRHDPIPRRPRRKKKNTTRPFRAFTSKWKYDCNSTAKVSDRQRNVRASTGHAHAGNPSNAATVHPRVQIGDATNPREQLANLSTRPEHSLLVLRCARLPDLDRDDRQDSRQSPRADALEDQTHTRGPARPVGMLGRTSRVTDRVLRPRRSTRSTSNRRHRRPEPQRQRDAP